MIKNLKKVISAIAAIALSASSFAAFAIDFPDVEETAYYSQAVQELSALGVISGVEEGGDLVFKPDDLVTRAEITKMIVDARNEGAAAAASAGSSKFNDVNNAGADGHWARGYINQGVADGWISGYSDTSFGPDDNVTFVQAQRMLVSAAGYDSFAQNQNKTSTSSDWSIGYQQYAGTLGIIDGVQGVTSTDQQLTRAQVAQMIDNAMNCPIAQIERWTYGYPVWTPMDKTYRGYQTMFTYYQKAYKVYGRVTATNRSSESNVDTDKVIYRVEIANNFDDVTYNSANHDPEDFEMFYGETNAPDLLKTYTQALIQKDSNDEFTILSIVPAASDKSVVLSSADLDVDRSTAAGDTLYFYPAGTSRGSVRYQLDDEVELYVNGVDVGSFSMNDIGQGNYIDPDNPSIVELQKVGDVGAITSSKYNVIKVTAYATAVVDQVIEKSDSVVISFKERSEGVPGKMTIQLDDETFTSSFKLGDEEIEPTDVQEYDVLSISYNTEDFADSAFYDVIVSRDTVDGKYTGKSSSTPVEYTFSGEKYKAASGISPKFDTSTEYTLYLDAFGRIAYSDEIDSTKKVGILKNVYQKNNGDWIAEVITKDGTPTEYTIDDANGPTYQKLVSGDTQAEKVAHYVEQVIEYKTTTAGKMTIVTDKDTPNQLTLSPCGDSDENDAYKESTGRLGGIKVSDAAVILDISDAAKKKDSIKVLSKDNLRDGVSYVAQGFDPSSSNKESRFIIITDGIGGIDSTSQLSVFVEAGTTTDEDGVELQTMTVINNGEEVTLTVDEDVTNVLNGPTDLTDLFEEGDALIYSLNEAGYVDEILPVLKNKGLVGGKYDDFATKMLATKSSDVLNNVDWYDYLTDSDEDEVSISFGAVVKDGNAYILAPFENGTAKLSKSAGAIDLSVGNAKVYTYNFDAGKEGNGSRLSADDGMYSTVRVNEAYKNNDTEYDLDNVDVRDDIVFGIVRTFNDDDAQEIYLIVAE